jgi:hypothetical protein
MAAMKAPMLPTHQPVDSTEKPPAYMGGVPGGLHPNEKPGAPPTAHLDNSHQQAATAVPPGTFAPPPGPPPS